MKNFLRFLCPLFLSLAMLASCGDDDPKTPVLPPKPKPDPEKPTEITNPKTANEWIDKYLSEWYLWPDDVKAKTRNYSLDYEEFFYSLLSTNRADGRVYNGVHSPYSYIERTSTSRAGATPENYIGFGYDLSYPWIPDPEDDEYLSTWPYLVVTYVTPGSDAEAQGIKRGDIIGAIDGEAIDRDNLAAKYYRLAKESARPVQYAGALTAASLGIYKFTYYGTFPSGHQYAGDRVYYTPELVRTITVSPVTIDPNPVNAVEVITTDMGKKVGYLAYHHFVTGFPEFEDYSYDDNMKQAFARFKTEGVNDVVIDLRYNGGGAVSSCQLMSSMIAPEAKLGTNFAKYERNSSITEKYFKNYSAWTKFYTLSQLTGGSVPGANLNKTRVYVIATERSASASEMVINALRGIDVTVYHIGMRTEGKTVGMDLVSSEANIGGVYPVTHSGIYDSWKYSMRPITFYIYNAKEKADYRDGFVPDYTFDEYNYLEEGRWTALGDKNEMMLSAALRHIDTGAFPVSRSAYGRDNVRLQYLLPTLDRNDGLINVLREEDFRK